MTIRVYYILERHVFNVKLNKEHGIYQIGKIFTWNLENNMKLLNTLLNEIFIKIG